WAAKSEEDADRSDEEAERAHNEANNAETSAGVAAAIVNDIASEKEVPIVGVVEEMSSIILPTGMTAIRTNGFNAMGDLGAWSLAVEVLNAGDLEAWHRLTNGGSRRWELRADDVSVKMFGAKGDGVTDDAAAIEDALHYWRFTGCTLFFPAGSYRMASGVLLDMSGVVWAGQIIMRGAIKPDPGIGAAITIRNVRGGHYGLAVNGGGQTADYRLADPVGGDESFRFVNCLGGVVDLVRGQNYKGRVLRVTSDTDNLGPDGFRTQGMLIRNCYFASAAKSTDPEATRLDQGVGQGFFIDTRAGAFGTIERAWWFWELYGSVVDRTTDMTINDGESLYRGISGLQLRGSSASTAAP
ncbi:glycoside hydrolase family 55 protein, partial [Rhizobium pusense]|uniref:glycosyl hydrolase family 28-related protein n=1 Tax=Agrobacterium pusense TaxID=648995 RepID=UPI00244D5997